MSGRAGRVPAALDTAEQLRGLIRDAHAAVKDLRAAIREARAVAGEASADVVGAVTAEYRAAMEHLQAEMNRNAAGLSAAVDAARVAVIEALIPAELEPDAGFKTLKVRFRGGGFDEDAQVKEVR